MKGLILIILLTWLTNCVLGCTTSNDVLSKFDNSEYVFIGTVVGYTKPTLINLGKTDKSEREKAEWAAIRPFDEQSSTVGLIVKVTDSVYLPKNETEFEIFFYTRWSDCSISGTDLGSLKGRFPVNSEVRVIAKESIFVSEESKGRLRLDDPPGGGGVIPNFDETSKRLTSAKSIFDYALYKYDSNRSWAYRSLPEFEARKDLLRLERASIASDRTKVFDRLLSVTTDSALNIREVFRNYAANESEADRYFESYLKKNDPEAYEFYMRWESKVKDLLSLGYQRSVVESAMSEVLRNGSAITDKDFLEKCKAILSKKSDEKK